MSKELTPVQRAAEAEAKVNELQAMIDNPETGIAALNKKLDEANKSATEANTQLAEANRLKAEAISAKTKVEGELANEQAAHKLLKDNFESELIKRTATEAAKVVASQGIPPVDAPVNTAQTKTEPEQKAKKGDYLASLAAGFKSDLAKINGK